MLSNGMIAPFKPGVVERYVYVVISSYYPSTNREPYANITAFKNHICFPPSASPNRLDILDDWKFEILTVSGRTKRIVQETLNFTLKTWPRDEYRVALWGWTDTKRDAAVFMEQMIRSDRTDEGTGIRGPLERWVWERDSEGYLESGCQAVGNDQPRWDIKKVPVMRSSLEPI